MTGNSNLHDSIRNRQDEFYTQFPMIENELKHYAEHFNDKIIFCNCDDPYESNFFKYFALNFNRLGIKKLITAGYSVSHEPTYATCINDISDLNNDGRINLEDIKLLLASEHNSCHQLKGDEKYPAGDFRSSESIKLLSQADIVVTNPPFSLFREYFSLLIKHKKKFVYKVLNRHFDILCDPTGLYSIKTH